MQEVKYREAERKLWSSVSLVAIEHRIPLASTGTLVRVLRVGEGEPLLFIHGGLNAGSTSVPLLGFGIERAHAVTSSFGSQIASRSAVAEPKPFLGMVHICFLPSATKAN